MFLHNATTFAVCISFNFVSCPQSQELTLNTDNVYVAAQKVGESPALCAANSSFEQSYEACATCLQANGVNNSTNNTLLPEFQPFISYCAAVTADPAGPAPTYLSAAKSSLLAQASSLGLTLGTTVQITQTSVVDHTVTVAQPFTCQLSLTHPHPPNFDC